MSISLDFSNCLSEAISATHGLIPQEVSTLVDKFPKHHENIEELRANGESCFFDLPYQDLGELKALIKKHHGNWDNLVVMGIGGSVVAPRSLFTALRHSQHNQLDPKVRKGAPKVFFLANPDPMTMTELFSVIDIKKTLFQIISKSGTTVESLGSFMWLAELLKKKNGKGALSAQVVITTDRDKSPLAEIAKQEKIDLLPIPGNLGGRFGVLGNAGLFAVGLCGTSIEAVLAGAAAMDKRCRHGNPHSNPAYMHSLVHYLLTRKRRKTIHVMFSFSDRLYAIAEWYSQMCGVSLGKMLNRKGKAVHVGPSPAAALGSFDLHGQQQLFAEGPFDKVVTFLAVKDHGAQITVPALYPKIEAAHYLAGAEFGTMLDHACVGAEQHITASGRPNMTLHVEKIDEGSIGGLYYMLELSTVMSAELYGIDPFDQPGIEHGKQASFAQFGRAGFEDLAKKLKDYRAKPRKTC
jgi:glucose-6-phosphate isomerase